jgi:hypothetical protein
MGYLGIIALCLGLISTLITIQYVNSTKNITDELKYIRNKCMIFRNNHKINNIENNIIILIKTIQKKYNLSLEEIERILINR